MRPLLDRACLVILLLSGVFVGGWAYVGPHNGPTDRVLNVVSLGLVVLAAIPLVVRPSAEDGVQRGRDPVQVERVDQ